jgi:hypothetical protein
MNITDEFSVLTTELRNSGIDFAVCGGLAMALHGFPRFTNDIDLLILPADLAKSLEIAKRCGFKDTPELLVLGQQSGHPIEIWRINKFQDVDHLTLDLILVSFVLDEVWNSRSPYAWQNLSLPVVSSAGLAKMKRLAGRPQDLLDIQSLGFNPDDPAIQA